MEHFGKYQLMQHLASGGMAEVWLATVHGEAGFVKPVVIKRLHPQLNTDPQVAQMLIDEARLTAQLSHPNICQVLDLGVVDQQYFIAMEYIAGEDLQSLQEACLERQILLPTEAAIFLATEILSGLEYAHRKQDHQGCNLGIVHRDISPANILVGYQGEVKIIDFGIAKARMRLVQTQAGFIKGKFRYMAPEQALGKTLDQRTDIFAAGVVLYELLSGMPHALDLEDSKILHKMQRAAFVPLQQRRHDLPQSLCSLVHQALRRNPKLRYSSANVFRHALMDYLAQTGSRYGRSDLAALMRTLFDAQRSSRQGDNALFRPLSTAPMDLPTPTPVSPPPPWAKVRKPLKLALGAGLGLLLGLSAFWLLQGHFRPLTGPSPQPAALHVMGPELGNKASITAKTDGAPRWSIRLQSHPQQASIIACGQLQRQKTPAVILLGPPDKPCLIELRLVGYQPHRFQLQPQEDRPETITVKLRPLAPTKQRGPGRRAVPPPAPNKSGAPALVKGWLVVTSIQVGTVYLDQRPIGSTPRLKIPLFKGRYLVKVYFPNWQQFSPERNATIRAGKTTKIHFDPAP